VRVRERGGKRGKREGGRRNHTSDGRSLEDEEVEEARGKVDLI